MIEYQSVVVPDAPERPGKMKGKSVASDWRFTDWCALIMISTMSPACDPLNNLPKRILGRLGERLVIAFAMRHHWSIEGSRSL